MAKNQENGSKILLKLEDCEVEEVREEAERVIAKETLQAKEMSCPHCGSSNLYRHGKCKTRKVLHSWSNGRRVYLELHQQRWQCRDCKHTFDENNNLVQPNSRMTRQAQQEALWQLRDRSFSQVRREPGVGYSALRRLLEKEIDAEALGPITGEEQVLLGIDKHSFKHQELVHMITEVKKRKVLGILKDDRIATLKNFLQQNPQGQCQRSLY